MAPVPIYTKSPISAAEASGVTPETAAPGAGGSAESSFLPPTRTVGTTSSNNQGYPSARPGAAPSLPAPTGSPSSSLDQRHAPIRPTPTTAATQEEAPDQGPPPPQPGAAPVPPSAAAFSTSHPPRAAGEATTHHHPATITAGPPQPSSSGLPHSAQTTTTATTIPPPPTVPYAQRGTSTTTGGPSAVGRSGGRAHLQPQLLSSSLSSPLDDDAFSHPPGYHQDIGAGRDASLAASGGGGGFGGSNSSNGGGGGGFGGNVDDEDDESVWNSAKKLAQMAGEKLSAAESEVWRRINKE